MLEPEVLEKLRCSNCHNYLSVLPIYSYGGEQNICGRCPVQEDFFPQQAILYETVIQNVFFPCQYEMRGCPEKTIPQNMKRHEEVCSYRPFQCPSLLDQCKFQGGVEEILTHFENEHAESIFKNVELDIVNVYEKNYVYFENNNTFIVSIKCNKFEGQLYAQVKYLNNEKAAENFSFLLQFSTKYNDMFYSIEGKVIFSKLKELDPKKSYQIIQIDDLKHNLNNPATIVCNIQVNRVRQGSNRNVTGFEEDLLRSIECPVCFCHMVPPILQCVRGHSFCKGCHEKLDNCPICRQAMSHTQNFVLEALTLKIGYPCKYQQFECPFYGSAHDIRNHEDSCTFGPFSCIIEGCEWKDNFEKLLDHVKKSHHDDYLDVNTVTYFVDPDCYETHTYVISKFGNIFKVLFKEDAGAFRWNLQLIGPDTDPTKYILELDIKSPTSFERIYYKKLCNWTTKSEDAFILRDSYIELTHDALEGMIEDDVLTYYCNVAQI